MPNPQYQLISATGSGTPVAVDWTVLPPNLSFAVELQGNATATFGVQYTLDDLNTSRATAWYYTTDVPQGSTATYVGSLVKPVTALRCEVASLTAAGSIIFAVLQGIPE
jgi:hypothetical protein